MSTGRRPMTQAEVPHLEALGRRLCELREAAGLSQARLADSAELSPTHIASLERGTRRTRASTLERLGGVLGADVEELIGLAGPALAPESPHRDRIERRRRRRWAKKRRRRRAAKRATEDAAFGAKLDAWRREAEQLRGR